MRNILIHAGDIFGGTFIMHYGATNCISCNARCEMLPSMEFRSTQCLAGRICMWPAANFPFEEGLRSMINSVNVIFSDPGFIFVDFSWRNINFFMKDGWINYLEKVAMKIILISDRKMMALAAFYELTEPKLKVISAEGGTNYLKLLLQRVLSGRPLPRVNTRPLTDIEKDVLYMTLNNYSVVDIAKKKFVDIKCIYNTKQRVENKLGIKIRRLL